MGARDQTLGRSRGGLTNKIHMLADTLGRPVRFRITPGQASDITVAPELFDGERAKAVLAGKAYDGKNLRARIAAMGAEAVIPCKRNPKVAIAHDAPIYRYRTRTSDASDASSTSAASPPATIAARSTSPASSTSPLP